jgi:hypothetical protein
MLLTVLQYKLSQKRLFRITMALILSWLLCLNFKNADTRIQWNYDFVVSFMIHITINNKIQATFCLLLVFIVTGLSTLTSVDLSFFSW